MLWMMSPEQSAVMAEWTARRGDARPLWIEKFEPGPDHTAHDGPDDLVSVILPTRDRGRMTRSAIESVLTQTWPHWELLVVDDGSRDDTALIAEVLAGRDRRVRVIRTDRRGSSAARNTGLEAAAGTWVAFLDSDECWESDFLRAMLAQLNGTGADAAYGNVRGLVGAGDRFRSAGVGLTHLKLRPLILLSSVIVRRATLDDLGRFDESLPRGGEYDFLIRLAARTTLQYAPVIGMATRVHPPPYDRVSTTESDDWIELVQTRHEVDWAAERRRFRVPNIRSFVVPVDADAAGAVAALRAAQGTDPGRWEAVFVDHSAGDEVAQALAPVVDADPSLSYVRVPVPVTFEHAATLGFPRTHGTAVTLVDPNGPVRTVSARDVIAAERVRPGEAR